MVRERLDVLRELIWVQHSTWHNTSAPAAAARLCLTGWQQRQPAADDAASSCSCFAAECRTASIQAVQLHSEAVRVYPAR